MERCLIADVQNRLIRKLSKGYRQRVGLAQAIVSDPHVLILDEPTIGLDPRQITEIRSLIKSLAGEHTVILSTHILPEVSMVCSGVVIINRGSIVAQGPIDRLVEQFFPTARVEVEIGGSAAGGARGGAQASPAWCTWKSGRPPTAPARYVVESARGRDVRGEIFQLAAAQKWGLRGAAAGGHDARRGVHADRRGRGDRRGGAGRAGASARRGGGGRVKIWPIFKKELRLYFTSPVAYGSCSRSSCSSPATSSTRSSPSSRRASMQSAMNPQMGRDLNVTDSVLRPLFSNVSVILLLLMPLVTMRLFAEERRAGTIELLLTYPVRDGAVLIGKYLAALTLYVDHAGRHAALPGDPPVLRRGSSGDRCSPATSVCC